MNKVIEFVFFLFISMILIYSGIVILIIGKSIYGPDAALLWASGILTYIGIRGLSACIRYLDYLFRGDEDE